MKFVEQVKIKHHNFNVYKCDCGEVKKIRIDSSNTNPICKCSKKTAFGKSKYYNVWRGIIRKSDKFDKLYDNKTVCEEWKNFPNFEKWCLEHGKDGCNFALIVGDKYSPETCAYLTRKEFYNFFKISDKVEETNLKKYGVKSTLSIPEVQNKIKKTNLERYGCENNLGSIASREKAKKTNIEKYGVENVFQSEEIKDKIKKTNLKRYGVKYASQCKKIRKKTEETNLKRYGFKSPLASPAIQEKSRKTSFERYGVKYPMQNKNVMIKYKSSMLSGYGAESPIQVGEIKSRIENTNLERYGVKNYASTKEFIEKSKKTCLEKYGVDHFSKTDGHRYRIREALKRNDTVKTYDEKLMIESAEERSITIDAMYKRIKKYGPEIAMSMKVKESGLETFFEERILKPLNTPYEKQFRVNRKIADFKIGNIIIECDGLYWHSEHFRPKNYHKDKRELYLSNGFKPLFFTEDEIMYQTEKVESILLNKLGKSQRIFARKCVIKEVSTKDSNLFFSDNHLMGKGRGKTFGLYFNNILVTAMRVCKLDSGLDISRFCHKLKTNVIGGFSKLIKHVERELSPEFIQTFIDLRYGSGDYLGDLGFEKRTENLSFYWIQNDVKVHRMTFPSNTGYQNGFVKFWDCGQAKYIKSNYTRV